MSRRSPASRRHDHAPHRRSRRAAAVLLLACGLSTTPLSTAVAAPSDVVTFADPGFRQCVTGNLGMPSTSPVTAGQAASLTELECDFAPVASLDGAAALTNLASLSLGDASTVSDLAPIAGLTRLQRLDAPSGRIADLAPLRRLTALTRLDVSGNPVVDLAPLSSLTGLTNLDVSGSSLTTLEPLRSLTGLRVLSVEREGQVDISALAALTGLQRLVLVVPDVVSLAPLRSLTALTQLTVQAAATDISPLAPLLRLRTLSLNVAGGDGAALAGKPDLTELSVYGVRLPSLDPLAASTDLTWLIAVSPGIKDVAALQGMTGLSTVVLSGVDRADVSPLSRLPQLSYLSISESRLGPLRQFDGFPALNTLELNENQLSSLDGFRMPVNLSSLDVSGNRLSDISRLGCTVLVNALAQRVDAGRARVGQPFRLRLATVAGQTVRLGRSSAWASDGTAITYAGAGRYRVPFSAGGSPECGGVLFEGVVSQSATAGSPMRPPRDH